ncbi:serine hydrolase domain-containing protein [Steroidobacter sp.]|uniref:serine hydrolase domain-containing protein n=1 Tax=Steroidobacter sp. TaxID=1978227 RepID=UPI001A5AD2A4|nr:serine hydrolase domain-containing protein [Steroidobacter sp.]MBL8268037.1 beta-lactamase family protein [Steroidobacter sp.]
MMVSSANWLRALLLFVVLGPMVPASAELASADVTAIDTLAKQAVIQGQTAGLVVAVAEQGKPVFVRGYGYANVEWDALATPNTVFRIGSITKQFASACVLLLAEQKKLSLDDKLAKYFPDFPRGNEVSLRQLMNHTSGIHSYPGRSEETIARAGISVPDMVQHLGTLGYDFDPGKDWAYSNSGYFLLGAVIEKVSGQSFRDFANQRLFQPLGLTHTAVDLNEEVVPQRASGYERDKAKQGEFVNAVYSHMSVPHAAGAIRSTAEDLIKWTSALHEGRVLGAASYKEMTTAPRITGKDPVNYGLGLWLAPEQGHALFSHNGGIDGFEASLAYLVERKRTLVILSNTQGGLGELRAKLLGVLLTEQR